MAVSLTVYEIFNVKV